MFVGLGSRNAALNDSGTNAAQQADPVKCEPVSHFENFHNEAGGGKMYPLCGLDYSGLDMLDLALIADLASYAPLEMAAGLDVRSTAESNASAFSNALLGSYMNAWFPQLEVTNSSKTGDLVQVSTSTSGVAGS
jgi:hypothetical protein